MGAFLNTFHSDSRRLEILEDNDWLRAQRLTQADFPRILSGTILHALIVDETWTLFDRALEERAPIEACDGSMRTALRFALFRAARGDPPWLLFRCAVRS